MGYHDRDGRYDDEGIDARIEPREPLSVVQAALGMLVRLVGVALLLIGVWAGASVVFEAWRLYEEPQRIERFADAIERGSNLDKTLSAITLPERAPPIAPSTPAVASAGETGAGAPVEAPASAALGDDGLRFSYFLAWIVALMLLVVVGGLAMSAVTTGGRLALYDAQVKKFSREVVREVRSLKRAA